MEGLRGRPPEESESAAQRRSGENEGLRIDCSGHERQANDWKGKLESGSAEVRAAPCGGSAESSSQWGRPAGFLCAEPGDAVREPEPGLWPLDALSAGSGMGSPEQGEQSNKEALLREFENDFLPPPSGPPPTPGGGRVSWSREGGGRGADACRRGASHLHSEIGRAGVKNSVMFVCDTL